MITRIVKLSIKETEINNFIALFEKYKKDIANFPGCHDVELIQDINRSSIFMTYSHWEEENNLLDYKKSELFGLIWPKTKAMFTSPAEAWSLTSLYKEKNHSNM